MKTTEYYEALTFGIGYAVFVIWLIWGFVQEWIWSRKNK